jgi:hypothetical protein
MNKREPDAEYSTVSTPSNVCGKGGAALARNMNACSVATYATEHAFVF